jgi:hypothetical protein
MVYWFLVCAAVEHMWVRSLNSMVCVQSRLHWIHCGKFKIEDSEWTGVSFVVESER